VQEEHEKELEKERKFIERQQKLEQILL